METLIIKRKDRDYSHEVEERVKIASKLKRKQQAQRVKE
jgi:hypothetical protein